MYNIIGDFMGDFLIYIIKGLLHYCNLLFGLIDFKDIGFMWFIFFVIFLCVIISNNVRTAIINLIKSFLGVVKTVPGFIFLILLFGYYVYIAIFFEEKITLILLFFSIYLFLQTYVNVNMDLLVESDNSIINSIKKFSIPVIVLCIQQIALMLENNNFNNLRYVLLSLIIIPIFSIVFLIFKHYCAYLDFYYKYKNYIKIDDYDFFKIYNESLILCKSYKNNNILLAEFLKENQHLSFEEMKQKVNQLFPKVILLNETENKQKNKLKKTQKKQSKLYIFFNYIWIINIIILVINILLKRFLDIEFGWTYSIVIIYFWYDLMKINKIKNQFDFCIYTVLCVVFIILLIIYSKSLIQFRLTELGFLLPIFIYTRYKTFYKPNLRFLSLPFLSEKNFFGLKPSDYKIKNIGRR